MYTLKKETAREFLDYFMTDSKFQTKTKAGTIGIGAGDNKIIFRGQSDSDWKLTPSAFRDKALDKFVLQPPYDIRPTFIGQQVIRGYAKQENWSDSELEKEYRLRDLSICLYAELDAIRHFLDTADSLGIATPINHNAIKENIKLVLDMINKKASHYEYDFPSENLQQATALAQHHGVPTRYLDWSESALIAMYFAAIGVSNIVKNNEKIASKFIAVYHMSTIQHLLKEDSHLQIIKVPKYNNDHLRVQKGIFTNIRVANNNFLEFKEWPSTEDVTLNIYQTMLPVTEANQLLCYLYDLGITRHSVMPTLKNAAHAYDYKKLLFPN